MIGDRWGVSDEETSRSYPCDGFVAAPTLQAWRGVTVQVLLNLKRLAERQQHTA